MSMTVKIPTNRDPWDCVINTKYYGPWPAGSIQTVPDEVAALIRDINAADHAENPPESLEQTINRLVADYAGARLRVTLLSRHISDEEPVDITERFTYEIFETLVRDRYAEISLQFTYDSTQYNTREFYRAQISNQNTFIFPLHHFTEGAVDGEVLFKVYTSERKVYGIVEKVLYDAE